MIRQETAKGNLGKEAWVSTKKTSQDKYRVSIKINQGEVEQTIEKLIELGISETDIKVR
jgi:hypothetical protein